MKKKEHWSVENVLLMVIAVTPMCIMMVAMVGMLLVEWGILAK